MIRKLSKKRANLSAQYRRRRKRFLEDNPICQAGLDGCTHHATQIHHQKGRIGMLLIDMENFLAVCHCCHQIIEHAPEMAKQNGYSKSRLT